MFSHNLSFLQIVELCQICARLSVVKLIFLTNLCTFICVHKNIYLQNCQNFRDVHVCPNWISPTSPQSQNVKTKTKKETKFFILWNAKSDRMQDERKKEKLWSGQQICKQFSEIIFWSWHVSFIYLHFFRWLVRNFAFVHDNISYVLAQKKTLLSKTHINHVYPVWSFTHIKVVHFQFGVFSWGRAASPRFGPKNDSAKPFFCRDTHIKGAQTSLTKNTPFWKGSFLQIPETCQRVDKTCLPKLLILKAQELRRRKRRKVVLVGADLTRPVVQFRSPLHGCHPQPAINQVRMCYLHDALPPTDVHPPWCTTTPTDVPPPPCSPRCMVQRSRSTLAFRAKSPVGLSWIVCFVPRRYHVKTGLPIIWPSNVVLRWIVATWPQILGNNGWKNLFFWMGSNLQMQPLLTKTAERRANSFFWRSNFVLK